MNKENFFNETLPRCNDSLPYYISQRLADAYPDKFILEEESGFFKLEEFARDWQCARVFDVTVHNHIETQYCGAEFPLRRRELNVWLSVQWKGHLLEVVRVTYNYGDQRHWILADSREVAEEFYRAVCDWNSEVRSEILVYDQGCWGKHEQLFEGIKSASFDNLILPDKLKQEIQNDLVRFFASRELYEQHNIPWKRGVLLIGPPGNGKTHAVKAILNHLGQPCLYVKTFENYCGVQFGIQQVFARARKTSGCVIVLEDLDSLVSDANRSFFLNEMDGFAQNTGIAVLATTNYPKKLDPALLQRPSRFDRKYYFELPALSERLAYIARWNETLADGLRLDCSGMQTIADKTEEFSFAYLKELFVSAMMQWISDGSREPMAVVMQSQIVSLREQMQGAGKKKKRKAT
jgi:AAA+ superfamily predicted ATPase